MMRPAPQPCRSHDVHPTLRRPSSAPISDLAEITARRLRPGVVFVIVISMSIAWLPGCGDGSGSSQADVVEDSTDPLPDVGDADGDVDADDANMPQDIADADVDADTDVGEVSELDPVLSAFCPRDAREVEARIDAWMETLTLDQKTAIMHGDFHSRRGGLWPTNGLDAVGLSPMIMMDGPRGANHGQRDLRATAFPVGAARGATWDPELEHRVGLAMAAEVRAVGGHVLLAPTMNILRHPRWGRAQETYGEDTYHLGVMASAFIRGVQDGDVAACAKHYAANSVEDTRFEVDVRIDERALREVYLPHFERVVRDARVATVMTAYNLVRGEYAAENDLLVREILKGEWAFPGLVVSDWILGTRSTVGSAIAGLDLEMPAGQFYGQALRDAVLAGDVPEELIDDAARRILRVALCYAIEDDTAPDTDVLESDAHLELALEVATRGMVLLRNADGVLPLALPANENIVITGRNADEINLGDEGSSRVTASRAVTALDGLRAQVGDDRVVHLTGEEDEETRDAALEEAYAVLVVTGLRSSDEGEGLIAAGDRTGLTLRGSELEIIERALALNDRVIVVLQGGGAITLGDLAEEIPAIVMAWYPGVLGGRAIANTLFGEAEFSGRLPATFPRASEDLPEFDNVSHAIDYDRWHGYWYLEREETPAWYPFGFGLSYTDFSWSDASLSAQEVEVTSEDVVRATVRISNDGTRAGTETVQVYAAQPSAVPDAFSPRLIGFAQVMLAPGEDAVVEVDLDIQSLKWFDPDARTWRLEAGEIAVFVARHAEDRSSPLTLLLTE